MTLDEVRAAFPANGFALYAYAPGGPITAEMHWPDGSVLTAEGRDEDEALRNLFGMPPAAAAPAIPHSDEVDDDDTASGTDVFS